MDPAGGDVRGQRSARTIAVTGASSPLGAAMVERLRARPDPPLVTCIDKPTPAELEGVDAVVHLATDRSAATPDSVRHALNVEGTRELLEQAATAGVPRVVLLTSAMVYGAEPAHPVPLEETAPLVAEARAGLVGDWLAMERAGSEVAAAGGPEIVSVRPASLVGLVSDALLPGLFSSVRLLAIRDGHCHWQFCHTEDLLSALVAAADGVVAGAVTVGCQGWMARRRVEAISGMRSIVLPTAVAFATAERLYRVGVLSSPPSDLHYLMHPWVVGAQQLRAAGWTPAWTNEAALRDHLLALGDRVGRSLVIVDRKNATRAAASAGATVAVMGSLALARSRARKR